jgi:hypothetical protein
VQSIKNESKNPRATENSINDQQLEHPRVERSCFVDLVGTLKFLEI